MYVPNILTLSRFPLGALFLHFHMVNRPILSISCAILACLSDWLDGKLARAWNCMTPFGAQIDPYADKFTCWVLSGVLVWDLGASVQTLLYAPVLIIVFAYDVGLGVLRYVCGRRDIPTNKFAKMKTTFLMTSLLILYADSFVVTPLGNFVAITGIALGWFAAWYAIRAAHTYLCGYKMEWVIPPQIRALL